MFPNNFVHVALLNYFTFQTHAKMEIQKKANTKYRRC